MQFNPRVTYVIILGLVGGACLAAPAPLGDRPHEPLLPSGISQLPLTLSGRLASFFKDESGTDVIHLVGNVQCALGGTGGQSLRGQEAIIWVNHRAVDGRPFRHVEMFLWHDAEVREIAGTVTSGPALFVTLDCGGTISTEVDEFSYRSSAQTRVYQVGSQVRAALASLESAGDRSRSSLRIFDPTGHTLVKPDEPTPVPVVQFQSKGRFKGPDAYGSDRLITVVGRVHLARGVPGTKDYLEIQADSAVVFLPGLPSEQGAALDAGNALGGRPKAAAGELEADADGHGSADGGTLLSSGFGEMRVEGAYLEGDVVMAAGPNMVRASRLYYDFQGDRALILDAVVRTTIEDRGIPLYVRAAEIRQRSARQYSARDAILTTSEFHTPHYHVGASEVQVTNRTPPDAGGGRPAMRAGDLTIRNATLNLGGAAIAYWPFLRGTVDTSETAIKSFRTGYSGDFGVEFETRWHLFNVLGLERPQGFDAEFRLDYLSDRGPAAGVNADYERDSYFGLIRSYAMFDDGEDFLGRDREEPSRRDTRGRFLVRHRQYLPDDWQLTLEASYISDGSFLEEFFESEFDNEKEQETLLYLKKQRENWAFSALLQGRILDFTSTTDRLPDFAHQLIGEPLGERMTWFSEARAGIVRLRAATPTFTEFLRNGVPLDSGSTFRTGVRQELGWPVDVGPVRLVPFVVGRADVWDDSPERGGVTRGVASVGVRGSLYLSRTYPEYHSSLFDINGLRHVIKSDVTAWFTETNRDTGDLFPFDDGVEGVDSADGVAVGVRQRWQTRRGADENLRTVDVVTWDTQLGIFNDSQTDVTSNGFVSYSRPENSTTHNHVNSSFIWRVNDRTALLNELNYDVNDGEVDVLNVSLAVERTPRLGYLLGYRFIEESDSNLLAFDMNYRLSEKHTLALRELFDLNEGRTLDLTLVLIRKLPGWFTALSFDLDEAEDDFGVSISVWPEGVPQAAVGSRRFTGLAHSTGISRN